MYVPLEQAPPPGPPQQQLHPRYGRSAGRRRVHFESSLTHILITTTLPNTTTTNTARADRKQAEEQARERELSNQVNRANFRFISYRKLIRVYSCFVVIPKTPNEETMAEVKEQGRLVHYFGQIEKLGNIKGLIDPVFFPGPEKQPADLSRWLQPDPQSKPTLAAANLLLVVNQRFPQRIDPCHRGFYLTCCLYNILGTYYGKQVSRVGWQWEAEEEEAIRAFVEFMDKAGTREVHGWSKTRAQEPWRLITSEDIHVVPWQPRMLKVKAFLVETHEDADPHASYWLAAVDIPRACCHWQVERQGFIQQVSEESLVAFTQSTKSK